MEGWSKVIAGALIGVAGTVYATNEEFRKRLPETARDLPGAVRNRFTNSVAAAREASARRRAEILKELENHGGSETERFVATPGPDDGDGGEEVGDQGSHRDDAGGRITNCCRGESV